MTYETFKERLHDEIESGIIDLDIDGVSIKEETIPTSSGMSDRMIVSFPGRSTVSMAFRLQESYDRCHGDEDEFKNCVSRMLRTIADTIPTLQDKQSLVTEVLSSYELAKDYLGLRLIPGDAPVLDRTPHILYADDLALVCQIVFEGFEEDGRSCTIVCDEMLKMFGVNKETLFRDATKNAAEKDPMTIIPMSKILAKMNPDFELTETETNNEFFVASTMSKMHGAAVLGYENFFENAADVMSGGFFILPSSVHELILLPEHDYVEVNELDEMVKSVNANELRSEEILSDHCYHYDAKEKIFESGEQYVKRISASSKQIAS